MILVVMDELKTMAEITWPLYFNLVGYPNEHRVQVAGLITE